MLTNPVPGPPASVLSAVLVTDPDNPPVLGQGRRATFSTTNWPNLPSLMTEVVTLPVFAELNADVEITGILVSQGWATQGVTAVTGAYTTLPSDAVILCNATSGAFTVTLADATGVGFSPGQRYTIIKTDSSAHNVTIAGSAGQDIGGSATQTLTTTNAFISVVFDGINTNNWWIWGASATGSGPTGAAGGVLSGTYPNPGFALPVALSGNSNASLFSVTNAHSNPSFALAELVSQTAGDPCLGVEVTGDTNNRFKFDSNGKHLWGSGTGTQDTNLYRSAANTLKTDDTFIAAGGLYIGTTQVLLPAAPAGFTPANPSSTTSTVQVMMGLGGTCFYTPAGNGHVQVTMSGSGRTNGTSVPYTIGGRYGIMANASATTTTVAAGSNGGTISAVASWSSPGAGTLDVASTTGYATAGTVWVAAGASSVAQVTYTGTAAGALTGCAYVNGSAAGTVATGGSVTPWPQNGANLVGSRIGGIADVTLESSITSGGGNTFVLQNLLSLTGGDSYWFDAGLATSNASDSAQISNVAVSAAETLA